MRPSELLFQSDQGPDEGLQHEVFWDFYWWPDTDGNMHHWEQQCQIFLLLPCLQPVRLPEMKAWLKATKGSNNCLDHNSISHCSCLDSKPWPPYYVPLLKYRFYALATLLCPTAQVQILCPGHLTVSHCSSTDHMPECSRERAAVLFLFFVVAFL